MRVTLPGIFNDINRDLQRLQAELQQVNESIASGRKYQNISQNPTDMATALGYKTDLSQINHYQRNLQGAETWVKGTESILRDFDDLLKAAEVLAEQMATGTINDDNRAAAVNQVESLIAEFLQTANTEVRGQYLLSGYKTDTPPFARSDDLEIQAPLARLQASSTYTGTATSSGTYTGTTATTYLVEIDAAGAVGVATFRVSEDGGQTWTSGFTTSTLPTSIWSSEGDKGVRLAFSSGGNLAVGDQFILPVSDVRYQGDDNPLEIGIGRDSRLAVNVVGRDAVDGGQGRNDIFQLLNRLKGYLAADDSAGAGAVLAELQRAEENVLKYLTFTGAQLDRLSYQQDTYIHLKNSLENYLSKVADTDLIEATKEMNLKQVAYQAALLSSTKVMELSLLNYL